MTSIEPTILSMDESPLAVAAPTPELLANRRRATAVLLTAVILGILGDALLRTDGAGVNIPLWSLAAVSGALILERQRSGSVPVPALLFAGVAVFFASVFAWRETEGLLVFSMLSMLTAFGMLAFALARWPADLIGATLTRYLAAAFGLGLSAVFGALLLVAGDGALARSNDTARRQRVWPVVRGLVIALPILFVFAELLGAADPRFADFLARIIDLDLQETIGHVVFAGFVAWAVAGYLRGALVAREPLGVPESALRGSPFRVGATELVVPLVLLDVLFIAFIAFQLPYLFGGASHLREVAGLTAAEYARRGFFELVAVAALLLPLLLVANALLRRDAAKEARVFRVSAMTTIALLAVIMFSAMQRMRLYTAYFGLTESRIYASAAMIWLAIVFALFAATVLRGRSRWFAIGSLIAAWSTVAALAMANPAAMIVRTNIARALEGREVDTGYLTKLGADAAPALAEALPRLNAATRCDLAAALAARGNDRARGLPEDWRWWNSSARRAFEIGRQLSVEARQCPAIPVASEAPRSN
jgi:hypothetical protein